MRGRQARIAGRARSVRFVRVVRVRARDLRRGQRSRFVHAVRAKDLRRGQRSRFVRGLRVSAEDMHHGRRRHFVRGVRAKDLSRGQRSRFVRALRVSAEGMRHGRRRHFVRELRVSGLRGPIAKRMRGAQVRRESFVEGRGRRVRIVDRERIVRFVRGAKVRAKDLLHDRRSRFVRGERKAMAELQRRGRSVAQRAEIVHGRRVIGSREAIQALAASRRSAPRRSLAVAHVNLAAGARRAERVGLEANRSLDRSPAVPRLVRRVDRARGLPSRGVRQRSSCEV